MILPGRHNALSPYRRARLLREVTSGVLPVGTFHGHEFGLG